MNITKQLTALVLGLMIFLSVPELFAAELSPAATVASRYIWRGKDFGSSPAIQPGLEFKTGNFAIGAWGSLTLNDNKFQEQDIYLSYNITEMFTVIVTDYFFPNDDVTNNKYFNYKDGETGHIFESTVKFNGVESFPLSVAVNYNFYGADADNSAYIELTYSSNIGENNFDIFLGATAGKGIYGDSEGVVNLGISSYKDIKFSESFTLPVFSRLIFNPQAENIHFVFGLTL